MGKEKLVRPDDHLIERFRKANQSSGYEYWAAQCAEKDAEIERLTDLKAKREDMLGEKIGEIERLETENRELQQHLHLKLSEVERLRGALEKIANVYPCSDIPAMARLARETLGA